MRTDLSCVAVVMMSAALFACGGGSGPTGAPAGNNDTGDDGGASTPIEAGEPEAEAAPPVDHGAPSTTYPAFTPAFGQLQNNGGYIMKNPVIVPVTWDSDPSQANFDAFADQLGPSNYWKPDRPASTASVRRSAARPTTCTSRRRPPRRSRTRTCRRWSPRTPPQAPTAAPAPREDGPRRRRTRSTPSSCRPGTSLLIASGYGSNGNTPTDACAPGRRRLPRSGQLGLDAHRLRGRAELQLRRHAHIAATSRRCR